MFLNKSAPSPLSVIHLSAKFPIYYQSPHLITALTQLLAMDLSNKLPTEFTHIFMVCYFL